MSFWTSVGFGRFRCFQTKYRKFLKSLRRESIVALERLIARL